MSLHPKGQLNNQDPEEQATNKGKQPDIEGYEQVDPRYLAEDCMYLSASGVIESGECEDEETLQIQYKINHGDDWKLLNGKLEGNSQSSSSYNLYARDIVFNFPFDVTYSTLNPHGWPQLVLIVKGPDFLGRQVIKGYGGVHFPTEQGYHERVIRLYRTLPASLFNGFFNAIQGQSMAKYSNAREINIIAKGEGRDVTRVQSVGQIKVKFQVMKRNFKKLGYN